MLVPLSLRLTALSNVKARVELEEIPVSSVKVRVYCGASAGVVAGNSYPQRRIRRSCKDRVNTWNTADPKDEQYCQDYR